MEVAPEFGGIRWCRGRKQVARGLGGHCRGGVGGRPGVGGPLVWGLEVTLELGDPIVWGIEVTQGLGGEPTVLGAEGHPGLERPPWCGGQRSP